MIRAATRHDVPAAVDLAIAAELFAPEDTGPVRALLTSAFEPSGGDHLFLVDDGADATVAAVAYVQPKVAADRVWDLTMIAVAPELQGRGRGRALLGEVERQLTAADARLLLVETSGLEPFDTARAFYRRCGYDDVARIPGYWSEGDDLVIFVKALAEG